MLSSAKNIASLSTEIPSPSKSAERSDTSIKNAFEQSLHQLSQAKSVANAHLNKPSRKVSDTTEVYDLSESKMNAWKEQRAALKAKNTATQNSSPQSDADLAQAAQAQKATRKSRSQQLAKRNENDNRQQDHIDRQKLEKIEFEKQKIRDEFRSDKSDNSLSHQESPKNSSDNKVEEKSTQSVTTRNQSSPDSRNETRVDDSNNPKHAQDSNSNQNPTTTTQSSAEPTIQQNQLEETKSVEKADENQTQEQNPLALSPEAFDATMKQVIAAVVNVNTPVNSSIIEFDPIQETLFPEENAAMMRQSGSADVQTALWDMEESTSNLDWEIKDPAQTPTGKQDSKEFLIQNKLQNLLTGSSSKGIDGSLIQNDSQSAPSLTTQGVVNANVITKDPSAITSGLHPEALRLFGLNTDSTTKESNAKMASLDVLDEVDETQSIISNGAALTLGKNAENALNPNSHQGGNPFQNPAQNAQSGTSDSNSLELLSVRNSSVEFQKWTETKTHDTNSRNSQSGTELPSVRLQQLEEMMRREAVGRIASLQRKGNEEIQMQLMPAHLGKVHVALELREGIVNARIHVENETARAAVDASLLQLRDALSQHGLKVESLDVILQDKHAGLFNPDGSNADGFFNQQGRKGLNGGRNGNGTTDEDVGKETKAMRQLGYNTLELLA